MSNFNDYLVKEVIRLYKQDWIADKIAIKLAVPIFNVQMIIYKEFKVIV